MIPEHVVYAKHCGTHSAGYMKKGHKHPSKDEGIVNRTVCFNENEEGGNLDNNFDLCGKSVNITIRNCGEFYIYKLDDVPCDTVPAKYCGTNKCPTGTYGSPPCEGISNMKKYYSELYLSL